MFLSDISIRRRVFAWMLMACTVLFGLITASRIGISQYPDVDYPNINVSLSWPGASPAAVETEILNPIEQALAQVEGIQQLTAQARQGSALNGARSFHRIDAVPPPLERSIWRHNPNPIECEDQHGTAL